MRIIDIDQNSDEWLELRKGKITGSKLKDIVVKRGTSKKIGFYQLIADKLALEPEDEFALDRGHRLEHEAIEQFELLTGKSVNKDVGLCISDVSDDIALSPDGLIEVDGEYKEAVEVKCLGSARHIQAIVENQVPDDFKPQMMQYFIVNELLTTLHFVFYDPRVIAKPVHVITVNRSDIEEDIEFYRDYQIKTLKQIDDIVTNLAF